jgi:hypothetical protein
MSPTIVRFCKRGNRIGVVTDVKGDFYFQVYDINTGGSTHLIYSCPYDDFETPRDGRMGALDHWLIFEERGNF